MGKRRAGWVAVVGVCRNIARGKNACGGESTRKTVRMFYRKHVRARAEVGLMTWAGERKGRQVRQAGRGWRAIQGHGMRLMGLA